jgi:Zn-dependent protease
MLRNPFNFGIEDLIRFLYYIPIFLITLTVHEVSHGYAAYKLGDPTAKNLGRLTLNPLKHIDILGFIMMILVRFGWAKPVPINPRNFKNPQKGMAISALAGPAANFGMGILGAVLMRISYLTFVSNSVYIDTTGNTFLFNFLVGCYTFFSYFYMLNIYFGVFNLLPVPPLDGSRIVTYFLPPRLAYQYAKIERYGFIVLMILMYTGILLGPMQWIAGLIESGINFLLNLIPFLRY